MILVTTSEVHN